MKGFKNNSYPGGGYNGPHGQESELYKGNMQNPKDAGYYEQDPYYQNSYPQSTYQDHYGRNEKRQNTGSGFAIAGLVLGIMSIVLFWTMPIAMILAVIGIILSVIALSKNQSRGLSIAGIITSIVGGILSILAVVLILITLAELDIYDPDDFDDNIFSPYPYAENEQENPFKDFEDFFDEFMP